MNGRVALAAVLGAALLTAACAPARLSVGPEFWQDRHARVGVALTPRPEAAAHRAGAQALLDEALDAGLASDLRAHLQRVDVSSFESIRDRFVEELGRRGMNVVAVPGHVDPARFPARAADAIRRGRVYERDLGALRREERLDAIVLLQVRRYGTIRSYDGFIPVDGPSGFFEVKGQLVDLRTGALVWEAQTPEAQASVAPRGDWDQPPRFVNLTAALRMAIWNGNEFLLREFFGPDATPSSPGRPHLARAPAPAATSVASAGR